jgi:hypothetical protein
VSDQPWAYVRRADFASPDLTQRIQNSVTPGQQIQAVEHAHARPDRDLHLVERTAARPLPRDARTRPSPGDTTPALRTDTAPTMPFPVARRRHRDANEEAPAGQPAAAATPRAVLARPMRTPAEPAQPAAAHPTDARHRGDPADARSPEARPADADHEVLRRVFGPLSQPRPAETGGNAVGGARPSAQSARPTPARPGARETSQPVPVRAEPRAAPGTPGEPQQAPSPAGSDHAVPRPQSKRDH